MALIWIDIETSAGAKVGSGPISTASKWRSVARMDRAGVFDFEMAATDAQAANVTPKRVVRAWAIVGGVRTEIGAGIIDKIERIPGNDGRVSLRVSGDDLIRELTYRSVLDLKLYAGNAPITHAAAVSAIGGFAPAGWAFTADPAPPLNSIYGYFNGETVLAGATKIAEKSQNHFTRGAGRTLTFASVWTNSGVRAIQARGDLAPTTAAIASLTQRLNTYDLLTRIYPRGSGNSNVQLTLRATTRTAPPGYVLNAAANYIESTAGVAAYGRIERQIDFRDIGPIDNTTPDIVAASNALFDAALETLRRQSEEIVLATYDLRLQGCSQILRPMQMIRVSYRDSAAGLNINQTLNILEATIEVSEAGLYTTNLVVSNADRWPPSDVGTIADSIAAGHVYSALQQLNANSYVTAYTKNVDKDHTASFRFRFGNEVTQLQQVLFEFQTLQFESTVKSVGGESGGSGEIPTTGPSADATGAASGDNNTSGQASGNTGDGGSGSTGSGGEGSSGGPSVPITGAPSVSNTGTSGGGVTLGPNDNTTSVPSTNTSGAATGNTGQATGSTGTASGNTGTASGNTGGSGILTTDEADGGDTDPSGFHQHATNVIAGAGNLGNVTLHNSGGLYFLSNPFVTGSEPVYVTPGGEHFHSLADHDHTLNNHTHSLNNHSHSLNNHSHDLNDHTHSMNSHTHDLGNHTHGMNSHTHGLNGHVHDLGTHTHDMSNHSHSLGNHSHTLGDHAHSLNAHTHTLSNHTHNLATAIEAVYGIFRAPVEETYTYSQLEYRVNSGAWAGLGAAVDAGNGWRRVDITALVMDATTYRPLQTNNILEIRGAAGLDKTATIDAQLSVRNIIQAVGLT